MLGVAASGLAVLTAAGTIAFVPDVRVRGSVVRLGDVANLDALPETTQTKASDLVLIVLPKGKVPVSLSVETLSARARALMPVLGPMLPKAGAAVLVRRRSAEPPALTAVATNADGIAKGDDVRVLVKAGIFNIERQGIAMSDAKPGDGFFVRTADGKALSAKCCGGQE